MVFIRFIAPLRTQPTAPHNLTARQCPQHGGGEHPTTTTPTQSTCLASSPVVLDEDWTKVPQLNIDKDLLVAGICLIGMLGLVGHERLIKVLLVALAMVDIRGGTDSDGLCSLGHSNDCDEG
ncbi:hypothetical protein MRB53_023320 [Persea americana]|uniref:Uncharacterized protein n=1 Tax=Persea americana TaxID=3435 RepID=A0ACC2L927_PERAE|nr:hypothetical protein MRB53_023320 [Persea americana]